MTCDHPKKRDFFFLTLFLVFWIIPITYTGLTDKDAPLMPRTVCYIQRIANLFPHGIESWPVYYIQVKTEPNSNWQTLDEHDYFRLKPFGYRTRLHQLLYASKDLTGYKDGFTHHTQRETELALWIKERYDRNHEATNISDVRFIAAFYMVDRSNEFNGRWRNPQLEEFPPSLRLVLSTFTFL